jgi:hypothetical protein
MVKAEGSKQKSWETGKLKGSKLSADYADYTDFNGAHIEQFYNLKNHL